MRPQVVSKTTKHYDELIHAIETEGVSTRRSLRSWITVKRVRNSSSIIVGIQDPKANVQSPGLRQLTTDNSPRKTPIARQSNTFAHWLQFCRWSGDER